MKYILILLALKERYSVSEIETWMTVIQESGGTCILKFTEDLSGLPEGWISCMAYHSDETLVFTDSREVSEECAQNGYVCIGLDPFLETFFQGAEAVVSSFTDLDYVYMEETFLRAKGFSVLIAETERIRIREIRKEDIPVLYEISRQDGMEYAFADQEQAECFECARMEAYIANVYRFYGYGLWTAETLEGEIIGCCGLSDVAVSDKAADETAEGTCKVLYMDDKCKKAESDLLLELQYFVANRFQNQGYGTEMCRAVIQYAQERLPEYEVCVRVHPENKASVKLAEKMGFRHCRR